MSNISSLERIGETEKLHNFIHFSDSTKYSRYVWTDLLKLEEMFIGPFVARKPSYIHTVVDNDTKYLEGVRFPILNNRFIVRRMAAFFIVNRLSVTDIIYICEKASMFESITDVHEFWRDFMELKSHTYNTWGFDIKNNRYQLTDSF